MAWNWQRALAVPVQKQPTESSLLQQYANVGFDVANNTWTSQNLLLPPNVVAVEVIQLQSDPIPMHYYRFGIFAQTQNNYATLGNINASHEGYHYHDGNANSPATWQPNLWIKNQQVFEKPIIRATVYQRSGATVAFTLNASYWVK